MCTVVIDVEPGTARLLAVRDEDPQRDWDDLGAWWPEQYPGVIGIRDRRAGGAWLAFDPATRRLAVLLNRADLLDLPESELRSRGGLVLESVAGRSPEPPVRTHGFNLLEVSPDASRVLTWDGNELRESAVAPGVHMIAHDDLDDPTTPRIEKWLPRFRAEARETSDATDWASHWSGLLAETTSLDPADDRAIIRDNNPHGYPTMSLLYCTAEVTSGHVDVDSHVLPRPGHWAEAASRAHYGGFMADDRREMVLIPGGTFRMGSEEFYPDERPVHERRVAPFHIDRFAVTNADYARFVDETGYVTVAERPLDPAVYPGVAPEDLLPGAMVFTPTPSPVDLRDWRQWWRWETGAQWRRPFGPSSSIDKLMEHPVVHIAFEDAIAYADWAGGRLPTEAEHEYAARGGGDGSPFAWGDEPYPGGRALANSWLGRFPYDNRGVGGTAPVGSYPENGYGLFDMIGNTWEWTSDLYTPRHVLPSDKPVDAGKRTNLLAGAQLEEGQQIPRRVLKGGSFLCSPDYCLRFRPAARSPQAEDTGMSHVGFRLAKDA